MAHDLQAVEDALSQLEAHSNNAVHVHHATVASAVRRIRRALELDQPLPAVAGDVSHLPPGEGLPRARRADVSPDPGSSEMSPGARHKMRNPDAPEPPPMPIVDRESLLGFTADELHERYGVPKQAKDKMIDRVIEDALRFHHPASPDDGQARRKAQHEPSPAPTE